MVTKKEFFNYKHGESKSPYNHKKSAKCRSHGKKTHYERKCSSEERDLKV